MKAYLAFAKKEFIEAFRTYKILIIAVVTFIFGLTNPIFAKMMPEIMKTLETQGFSITFPEPTAIDSWTQFFKNMTSIQIIVFVIVFSGILANEVSKGTLINVLTKGLSRKTIILSKLTCVSVIWTISYFLCYGVTFGYTVYLFPEDNVQNLFFSVFCLWLFGMLLITVLIFANVLFSNILGSLIFTGGFSVLLTLLNFIPKVSDYNPIRLSNDNMQLLTGALEKSDFTIVVLIAFTLSIIFAIFSVVIFNKRQI